MILEGPRWFVVQAQPNSEHKAVAHLNKQGYATYLPRYLKRRRHARRVDTVAAPLFPRYLFVSIDMRVQRWRAIFSTIGVSRIVCNGEMPTVVPDEVIEGLRAREHQGLVKLDLRPSFRVGDNVRLLDGAFVDCLGIYEGLKDGDRVALLLDLLGRKVRVTVGSDSVVAA